MKNSFLIRILAMTTAFSLMGSTPIMVYAQEETQAEAAVETTTEEAAEESTQESAAEEGAVEGGEEFDVTKYVEEIEEIGNAYRVGTKVPEESVAEALDAVQKKAIELKNQDIVTEIVPRDSNILIKFINGYEYTWEAGSEPSEGSEDEEKQEMRVLQPASETPEQSSEENTRWVPVDEQNKIQQFAVAVPSSTVRYEIFYTAGSEPPKVAFQTTTAQEGEYLMAGTDIKEDGEDGFKFITKTGLTIEGHDDFRYMVIYISNTKDPGLWTMTVSAPVNMTEVIGVSSAVPDGWEDLVSDTITKPYGVIFWYVDAKKSQYREQPIATINELITAESGASPVDKMKTTVEEPVDYTPVYIFIGVIAFIVIVVIVVILIVKRKKKNKAAYIAKREAIVRKENEKVRKKKSGENDELDDILDGYSDEYIDDDVDDYIDVDDSSADDPDLFTDDPDDNGFYEGNSYESAQRVRDKFSDDSQTMQRAEKAVESIPAFLNESGPVQKTAPSENAATGNAQEDIPAFLKNTGVSAENNTDVPAWMSNRSQNSGDFF